MGCTFSIGQKVCCRDVEIDPLWKSRGETLPQAGEIYTIRDISLVNDKAYLRFKEITNPQLHYNTGFEECKFPYIYFEPLVENEIDISIFARILDDCNEDKKFGDEFKKRIERVKKIKELEVLH